MKPFPFQFNLARALVVTVLLPWAGQLTAAEIASPFEAAAVATGKSPHVDSTNQFVLVDTLMRFVPAARMEEKFPGVETRWSWSGRGSSRTA